MILTLLRFRGTIATHTASQAGVEQVSQRVSEHVGAPDDDEQGKPGPESQRRHPLHVASSFPTEHPSPAGDVGGQPKTKEAQGGLGNDHVANGHGEDDDHGRHDVGQHMPEEDLARGDAHGPGCQKIHILLDADDSASRDSRTADAADNAQHQDDLQLALSDQRHHRDQNEQPREGHPRIDKPLHHHIELATEEPGRRTDQQRDHQVDAGCGEANDHRNACPMDDSAEDVSPQLVGAQRVLPGRRGIPVQQVNLVHPVGGQQIGEDAAEKQQQHDDAAHGAQRLFPDKPPDEFHQARAPFSLHLFGSDLGCFHNVLPFH